MKIWALSDPHFGFGCDKPMDIFGDGWADYVTKLTQNWNACVSAGDVVLVSGDISWALKLSDAIVDLNYLGSLPGKKIIINAITAATAAAKGANFLILFIVKSLLFSRIKRLIINNIILYIYAFVNRFF